MDLYAGYIFDLDGTIYLGEKAIEGAVEAIAQLQRRGKKVLFLTNKTIESREKYTAKLNGFGIPVSMDQLLSPAVVTIHYLETRHPGARVYVIGEPALKEEMSRSGIRFARSPEETDVVVVSWDREFHYRHLEFAYRSYKRGAQFIATHPDRTCPVPGGELPDCGAMIGAIEGATNRKIDVVMGKPSALMALAALERMQVQADHCLMVGDRLETDILMGQQAGMNTALVLSGVTTEQELALSAVKPTYVWNSVSELVHMN